MSIGPLAALVLWGGGVFSSLAAANPAVARRPAAVAPASTAAAAPVPAASAPAAGLDVKAVTAEVQRRYDTAADFRAHFSQTLTSAALGRKTSSSGTVAF